MKDSIILKLAIIHFLGINTSELWMSIPPRPVGFFLFLIFLVFTFVLGVICTYQIFRLVKNNSRSIQRMFSVATILFSLGVFYNSPKGLINYDVFDSRILFIAEREGFANCRTIIKLKENDKFVEKTICFGIEKNTGHYLVLKDSIKFFFNQESVDGDKRALGMIRTVNSQGKNYEVLDYSSESFGIQKIQMKIKKNELN